MAAQPTPFSKFQAPAKNEKTPTTFTPSELAERMLHRRAIEAVIWSMPAVNYDLMVQALLRDTKGAVNQIVYWSRLSGWKNQTLTPNPDAIYLMPFINTKDVGPVVIEIPPADEGSITGAIMDSWQTPLAEARSRSCPASNIGRAGSGDPLRRRPERGGHCAVARPV